jgi:hypothetical protein
MGMVRRNTPTSSFLTIRDRCIGQAASVAAPDEIEFINQGIKLNHTHHVEAEFKVFVFFKRFSFLLTYLAFRTPPKKRSLKSKF